MMIIHKTIKMFSYLSNKLILKKENKDNFQEVLLNNEFETNIYNQKF